MSTGAGVAPMMDSDILARFRIFTLRDESRDIGLTLIFNIIVRNPNTGQTFDIRFPTQIHAQTEEERSSEERMSSFSVLYSNMKSALLRRVKLVRIQVPLLDDDFVSNYEPTDFETKFDETYSARTLANLFATNGQETTTLYFGF